MKDLGFWFVLSPRLYSSSELVEALNRFSHFPCLPVNLSQLLLELFLQGCSSIIVSIFLIPVPLILFLELSFFLLNLLLEFTHLKFFFLSLAHRGVDIALECKHWLAHNLVIVLQCVLAHLWAEFGELAQKRLDVLLAKTISIDMHECFVGVLTLLLEQVFIAADYSLRA